MVLVILMMRVYALYQKKAFVLYILASVWLLQVILGIIALTHSQLVMLPPNAPGCFQTGDGPLWAPLWSMPLAFDTVIFAFTMWATQKSPKIHQGRRTPLVERLRRDGILYFLCIFGANLMNTLCYLFAPKDLQTLGIGYEIDVLQVLP
ncbi:hypothetical protein M422DRAFT_242162 [Sphaerobolus stellatus SS14]|nr:hypothetical protein M422DRAFT_242162 [Sphaerobolus stellatus SS14]